MPLNTCSYSLCCLWLQNVDCLLLPQIAMPFSGLSGRSRSIYLMSAPVLCLWLGRGQSVSKRIFSHSVSPQAPCQELELSTPTDSHLEWVQSITNFWHCPMLCPGQDPQSFAAQCTGRHQAWHSHEGMNAHSTDGFPSKSSTLYLNIYR